MKIDFYAPKNYYGTYVFSFGGWLMLLLFLLISPYSEQACGNAAFIPASLFCVSFLFFFLLAVFFYFLEWLFQSKVKNQFFLKNKVYDFLFDLGCVFYLLPIVWFFETCKFRILPFAALTAIFVTIRTLKFIQDRREKKMREFPLPHNEGRSMN